MLDYFGLLVKFSSAKYKKQNVILKKMPKT